MTKKKWVVLGIAVVIVVCLAIPALFVFNGAGIFFRFSNPAVDYMKEKSLPESLVNKLEPLASDYSLDHTELVVIDEIAQFGEYVEVPSVGVAVDFVMNDGKVTSDDVGVVLEWDTDNDYVSDYLELSKYHSDHEKIDTDGGGIDDFNELYTYQSNPNDPLDDKTILQKIPDVARARTTKF